MYKYAKISERGMKMDNLLLILVIAGLVFGLVSLTDWLLFHKQTKKLQQVLDDLKKEVEEEG